MPPSDNRNRIDELKKALYSRSAPDVRTRRKLRFSDPGSNVKTDWEHPPEEPADPSLNQRYEDHSMSFFTKILIGSFIFCVAAVGLGAYLFFNGANLISANNIDITVSGPVSIPGGTPVSFDIRVDNKNNTDLQLVDLSVAYPPGTTDPANPANELKTYQELIGDIPAGGSATRTVQAIIFGEENLQKEIDVTVNYNIKGSTSGFTKTQTYDVLISSSPITVTASSFSQITSGQEFDMKVDLKSNSQQTLKNLLLQADYPFGFTYISSDLKPSSGNSTWNVGDIPPGGDKVVTIHGKLDGEDSDTRAFHFTVGAESSNDPKSIGTQYALIEQDMTIEKPFISLAVSIDNDQPGADHVGQFGQAEHVVITWFNNLSVPVSNMVIHADLSGSAYDKGSIQPAGGVFDSGNNEIIWNQQTNPDLGSVGAGDTGTVSFTLTPQDASTLSNPIVNPTINLAVSVSGNRTQESNVPQSLASAVSRAIKISPDVTLSGRIVRSSGPFTNTGPIPPKSEQATTYTVVWTVDNTSSSVGNAQVTATLPPYVKWLGNTSPSGEDVQYDKNSGTVTWNIGNVSTYTLSSARRREVSFQISLTPSIDQVGQSPTLVNQSTLTAVDSFTGANLQSKQDLLTTRFSTDPAYVDGAEKVVK